MDDIHKATEALPNLNRIAYREIEELIVTLRLAPGAVLSEADLAGRLGISRTPVREALQRLAREGLVRIMPRRGLLVTEVNIEKQLRMLEARREIERFLARHAAERRLDDEKREFLAIAEALAEAGAGRDEVAFTRADRDLNNAVARAARNEFAVDNEIISIDGVQLKDLDYVDIGEIIQPTEVVPLVIKSLLFSSPDMAAADGAAAHLTG